MSDGLAWLDLSQNITPPRAPCGAKKHPVYRSQLENKQRYSANDLISSRPKLYNSLEGLYHGEIFRGFFLNVCIFVGVSFLLLTYNGNVPYLTNMLPCSSPLVIFFSSSTG